MIETIPFTSWQEIKSHPIERATLIAAENMKLIYQNTNRSPSNSRVIILLSSPGS